jgi:hypothetical protein
MTSTHRGYADPGWNLVALLRALRVSDSRSWRVVRVPNDGRDSLSVYFQRTLVGSVDAAVLPEEPTAQAATMLTVISSWDRTWETPLAGRLLCPALDGNLMVAEAREGRIVLACPEFPDRPIETVGLQLGRGAGRSPVTARLVWPASSGVTVGR